MKEAICPASVDDIAELKRLMERATQRLAPGPWKHGTPAGWIWAPSLKGGDAHVADIRGWGYLIGGGHGALNLSEVEAIEAQEAWGELIVAAINALPRFIARTEAAEARAQAAEQRVRELEAGVSQLIAECGAPNNPRYTYAPSETALRRARSLLSPAAPERSQGEG